MTNVSLLRHWIGCEVGVEMTKNKGPGMEEVVRAYFSRQGFFALRGVNLMYEGDKVTDIDVWLYGKQSASVRTRTIVDVKDKRSPKAFERILWTRGMQLALGCDRSIVATTYNNPNAKNFAREQGVALLHKDFLERLKEQIDTSSRITEEQFTDLINRYKDHKLDGDWLKRIADVKSTLISIKSYPAFIKAMSAFRFFSERATTKPQYNEQAIRCAYFSAAIACVALDSALEKSVYESIKDKYNSIFDGVTYGDSGDTKTQDNIHTVLDVISSGMENGQVVARQVEGMLSDLFEGIRANIVAEFFSREHNASNLFTVAKELDDKAYAADFDSLRNLTTEAKSVLGIYCDFMQVKRNVVLVSNNIISSIDHPDLGDQFDGQVEKRSELEENKPTDKQQSFIE